MFPAPAHRAVTPVTNHRLACRERDAASDREGDIRRRRLRRPARLAAVMLLQGTLVVGTSAQAGPMCFGKPASIVGTPGSDELTGTPRADVIVGGDGDDMIRGMGGDDRLCGGRGNDQVRGGRGADRLRGGRPSWEEFLYGGPGDDVVIGGGRDPNGDGIWKIYGNRGDDRLIAAHRTTFVDLLGGHGNDFLDTRAGSGRLLGSTGDDVMLGRGYFDGGEGNDVMRGVGPATVSYEDATRVWIDLARGVAVGQGRDVVRHMRSVIGSPGDDTIYGTDMANALSGMGGSDRIYGRGGRDTVQGDAGDDVVDGGSGKDWVRAAPGVDVLRGGPGDDNLSNETSVGSGRYVAPTATRFVGGRGHDLLYMDLNGTSVEEDRVAIDLAGASSIGAARLNIDIIEGVGVATRGPVELYGTAGKNDLFVNSSPKVVLTGRGGNDVLAPDGRDPVIDGGAGTDLVTFFGPHAVLVDLEAHRVAGPSWGHGSIAEVERVIGSWASDSLAGDDGRNYLDGLTGNDGISGRGGDDKLDGHLGIDALDGGAGHDRCLMGEIVSNCEESRVKSFDEASTPEGAEDFFMPAPFDDAPCAVAR